MTLLLTNDDGVAAPGLAALLQIARQLGEAIVVAPTRAMSGCSHRVTTDQPLRLSQVEPGVMTVDGTPADCVRVALHDVISQPAWVLSGINAGGNLGADVHVSGTVAAVREAALHGLPGIAISQYRRRGLETDWPRAAGWVLPLLRDLMSRPIEPGTFWNINLPHLENGETPEIVRCPLDASPLPLRFRREGELRHYNGDYHERSRRPGTDVDVCFAGKIALTRISIF